MMTVSWEHTRETERGYERRSRSWVHATDRQHRDSEAPSSTTACGITIPRAANEGDVDFTLTFERGTPNCKRCLRIAWVAQEAA